MPLARTLNDAAKLAGGGQEVTLATGPAEKGSC